MKKKKAGIFKKLALMGGSVSCALPMMLTSASADGTAWDTVTVKSGADADAGSMMGKIIGVLLTLTRFVGVALIVYGVYEVVMSFMQNQPEAKTKGIIMALAGAVMTALKSILSAVGVISG